MVIIRTTPPYENLLRTKKLLLIKFRSQFQEPLPIYENYLKIVISGADTDVMANTISWFNRVIQKIMVTIEQKCKTFTIPQDKWTIENNIAEWRLYYETETSYIKTLVEELLKKSNESLLNVDININIYIYKL